MSEICLDNLSQQNKALICAYEKGYRCNIDGTICNPKGEIRAGSITNTGYNKVSFVYEGKDVPLYNHKLQAYQKFGNKMFDNGIQVRHLNGNPLDNSWDNIDIGTNSDNQMDIPPCVRYERALKGTQHVRKFSNDELKNIFDDKYIHGMSYTQLMKKYDIASKGTISFIINKSIFSKEYKAKILAEGEVVETSSPAINRNGAFQEHWACHMPKPSKAVGVELESTWVISPQV